MKQRRALNNGWRIPCEGSETPDGEIAMKATRSVKRSAARTRTAGAGVKATGLRCGLLRAAAAARGLGACDAAALALGDEVAALLDLAEDDIALDGLAEAREQMLWGLAVSKVN